MDLNRGDIKELIISEIGTVKSHVAALKDLTRPISPENAIGRVSRMDAINNKSINEASLSQAEEKLKKLEIALRKVDDKDFGICIRCKKPIPIGRLMLMPQASKCVNCA